MVGSRVCARQTKAPIVGIYQRPDSPFWWLLLERPRGQKSIREPTKVPLDGGSLAQTKENRRQAQEAYATRMADLARGVYGLKPVLPTRPFLAHREWYATHVSTQKRGTTREVSMLKQLGGFFDAYALSAIDHELTREWRTWRLEDVSASTVRREEELLKHLLTTAVPKFLAANPLIGLRPLRVIDPDTRVLTVDEEARLLAVLEPEARALVIGALDTLLRLSNIISLTRRQDHQTYLYSDTKTGAVRIPISDRFRKALDELPKDGPSFFPTYTQPKRAIDVFMEGCATAKIKTGRATGGISFHCLRHTGASRMLERGTDVKTVMEIGGWKSLAVLSRYLHPTDERKRAAVNSIGPVSVT